MVEEFLVEEYSLFVVGDFNYDEDQLYDTKLTINSNQPNFIEMFFGNLYDINFLGDKKVWSKSNVKLSHRLQNTGVIYTTESIEFLSFTEKYIDST